MNSTSSTSKSAKSSPSNAVSTLSKKATSAKMPTIAGISLPEIAVLGAAGFVLWKNREKVESFLTDNGIEVPSFLSGDLSELIQSGVSLITNKNSDRTGSTSARRTHDA